MSLNNFTSDDHLYDAMKISITIFIIIHKKTAKYQQFLYNLEWWWWHRWKECDVE